MAQYRAWVQPFGCIGQVDEGCFCCFKEVFSFRMAAAMDSGCDIRVSGLSMSMGEPK